MEEFHNKKIKRIHFTHLYKRRTISLKNCTLIYSRNTLYIQNLETNKIFFAWGKYCRINLHMGEYTEIIYLKPEETETIVFEIDK